MATPQAAACLTFGPGYPFVFTDRNKLPGLILLWGTNLFETGFAEHREWFRAAMLRGAKLVVVDPKKLDITKRADMWVRVRPASDGALVLGVIKVVIEENLYNKEFVDKWTIGFDKIREHVATFSFDEVERVTWVPKQQIQELARLYASIKPASIFIGISAHTEKRSSPRLSPAGEFWQHQKFCVAARDLPPITPSSL